MMKLNNNFYKKVAKLFVSALFLACVIEIIKHHDHLVSPRLEQFAFFVASNSVSDKVSNPSKDDCRDSECVVIAEIDDLRFKQVYKEKTPIDRTQIVADVKQVLDTLKPKVLFIDYDLSPISGLCNNNTTCESNHVCGFDDAQTQLDKLLDTSASKTKLLLLSSTVSLNEDHCLSQWRKNREKSGVKFTSGLVEENFGLATNYNYDENSLSRSIAALVKTSQNNEDSDAFAAKEGYSPYINFSIIHQKSKILSVEDITGPNLAHLQNSVVMLGGRYGEDDKFLTPIGSLYGIELHAAAYLSSLNPVSELGKSIVLLIDIALGMTIGFFAGGLWELIRNNKCLKKNFVAYFLPEFMIVLMALIGWGAILVSLLIAGWLWDNFNVWLNPTMLVIGMIIHSFVMTPTELVFEGEKHDQGNNVISKLLELIIISLQLFIFPIVIYGLYLYFH